MKLTINKAKFKLLTENKKCRENIEVESPLQEKTVTPAETSQEIKPDTDYAGLKKVTVDAIPYGYVKPSGSITLTENGSYNVRSRETVVVNVTSVPPYTAKIKNNGNIDGSITVPGVADYEIAVGTIVEVKHYGVLLWYRDGNWSYSWDGVSYKPSTFGYYYFIQTADTTTKYTLTITPNGSSGGAGA